MNDNNFDQLKRDYLRRQSEGTRNPFLILIIGIILIIVGICFNNNNAKFMKNAETTTGTIYYEKDPNRSPSEEIKYIVYAKYKVNGKEYYEPIQGKTKGKGLMSANESGTEITIYYNPNDPTEIRDKSSNKIGAFFIGFGILLIVATIGDFVYRKSKNIDMNDPTPNYAAAEKYTNFIENLNNETGFVNKFATAQKVYFSMKRILIIIVSILIIIFGIFISISEHSFSSNAKETTAEVTNIVETEERDSNNQKYTKTEIYVKYNVDGQQHEGIINTNYTNLKKGSSLKIYYNEKNYNEIDMTNKNQHVGAIVIVVGFTILIFDMLRNKK